MNSSLRNVELTITHIGLQAVNSQSSNIKQFDFDGIIKDIRVFFPSGHNANMRIFLYVNETSVIKNLVNDSTKQYLAGDNDTMNLHPNFPIRRNQELKILTKNVDVVFPHNYFIWITVKKERLI